MYPYTDSSVCSDKKRKVAAPNIRRGHCAASNGEETLIEAKQLCCTNIIDHFTFHFCTLQLTHNNSTTCECNWNASRTKKWLIQSFS
jgi:hypothetical protein